MLLNFFINGSFVNWVLNSDLFLKQITHYGPAFYHFPALVSLNSTDF